MLPVFYKYYHISLSQGCYLFINKFDIMFFLLKSPSKLQGFS
jgi:hypothetical protein